MLHILTGVFMKHASCVLHTEGTGCVPGTRVNECTYIQPWGSARFTGRHTEMTVPMGTSTEEEEEECLVLPEGPGRHQSGVVLV